MKKSLGFWYIAGLSGVVLGMLIAAVRNKDILTHVRAQGGAANLSRAAGVYFSPAYGPGRWGASIVTGNSSTGSQTDVFCPWFVTLQDGRVIQPFAAANATFAPITVDIGANSEVVTPTATAQVAAPVGAPGAQPCASVTASFSNTHTGAGGGGVLNVYSGDLGIQEAINDASLNGGGLVYWEADTGSVTLNTGALTTTTTTKVPANFISVGGNARVTTTITTTTNWAVGIAGSTSAFCTANATLTAGTTCIANMNSASTVGTTTGLTAILFTFTVANPGAGAIHAKVWGYTAAQSNF